MTMESTDQVAQVFIVLNPVAGRSVIDTVRATLDRYFDSHAWDCELYETTGAEDVARVVQDALVRGCDMVVAAGGDGTISAVANGLAHTEIPLGILPIGTGNVLAQELGIPLDLDAACRLLTDQHTLTCLDAMQVQDHLFLFQIAVGIESLMIRDTARTAKRRFGRLAYIWTALKWLVGYQPRRFTIVVDTQRLRPRASQVLIANGGTLGMQPFRWGAEIVPNDGRIDVCIVSARTVLDYLSLAWHIVRGQPHRSHKVRCLPAYRTVVISSDHILPVQGDGEIIGQTPVHVQVVPQAVRVIVPFNNKKYQQISTSDIHDQNMTAGQQHDAELTPTSDVLLRSSSERSSSETDVPLELQARSNPVRETLRNKLREMKTSAQARVIIDRLLAAAGRVTELEVHDQEQSHHSTRPADAIQQVAAAPGLQSAAAMILEAAQQLVGAEGDVQAALEAAMQAAMNSEQSGVIDAELKRPLDLLRAELLQHMRPLHALDMRLFLAINHMPHTPVTNRLMQTITCFMNGGWGWVIGLVVAALVDRPRGATAFRQVVPPLWFATMSVEYPIKHYFRRRRPFIDVVQAVAVGRKPGTYSFPSGHSAAAFAGAWLLRRHYPELTPVWYTVAVLIGFSRIYLGVHYPGDVISGAISGTVIAEAIRWLLDQDETSSTV